MEIRKRRGLLGLTAGLALGLALRPKKTLASALGEENAVLAVIASAATTIKEVVGEIKETTDTYLTKFNSYVDLANDTLENAQKTKDFIYDIRDIDKLLENQRKQISDFVNNFIRHDSDWTKIRLNRAPGTLYLLRKAAEYADFLDEEVKDIDDLIKKYSSGLNAEGKEKFESQKRTMAVTSHADLKIAQTELFMEALKDKRKENARKISARGKMDGATRREALEILAAHETNQLLEQLIKQQILGNELAKANLEFQSGKSIHSRYGTRIVRSEDLTKAFREARNGNFDYMPG